MQTLLPMQECLGALSDPTLPNAGVLGEALAVRQVVLAAWGALLPSRSAFLLGVQWAQSPQAMALFTELYNASEALCPLEASAHLTEELRVELEHARGVFAKVVDQCQEGFPSCVPVSLKTYAAIRTLGGMALAQVAWRLDVGYEGLSSAEQKDIVSESPALSVDCFLFEEAQASEGNLS